MGSSGVRMISIHVRGDQISLNFHEYPEPEENSLYREEVAGYRMKRIRF